MSDGHASTPVPADEAGTGHVDLVEQPWLRDLFCGAAFVAMGLGFAIGGSRYEIGSAVRMGPGYLPIVLGGALAVLGLVTIGQGFVARRAVVEPEPARTIPWARGALVVAAILFFGLTIDGLGVIPTVFVTALLSALAGQHTKPVRVVLTAVGITVVTWLIFVVALQLNLPLFGEWIGG